MSATTSATDIPKVPAPWQLKGEAWWFLISTPFHRIQQSELSNSGWFDPLHEGMRRLALEPGGFRPGDGMVQLLRYSESPIGPYDELLVIPGYFKSPAVTKEWTLRIARIYVSSLASVVHGRRNWNIPKALAKFTFTPSPSGALSVQVFASISLTGSTPAFADTPFFAATFRKTWFPSLPINLRLSPIGLMVVQPPLEGSADAAEDGRIQTEKWLCTDVSGFRGWLSTVRWEGGLVVKDAEGKERKRLADGESFPDVTPVGPALHFADLRVAFPNPDVIQPSA